MYSEQTEFEPRYGRSYRGLAVNTQDGVGHVTIEVKIGDEWVESGDGELSSDGYYEIPQHRLFIRITPFDGATFEYQ